LSPKPEGCYPPVGGHYRLMGPVGGDGGYVEAPSKKLMIIRKCQQLSIENTQKTALAIAP
ncbi:hypothetical protein, partial [Thiolapillus sp.]|uniref:hypothetical protein n=1 Tax=Thiolapillus sp. TaxID=2017437 RepID=UPI0025D8960D